MFLPESFDLNALDDVLEGYDYAADPTLQKHFRPIEDALWSLIEHYGTGVNDYGQLMAAHLRRTSLDASSFMRDELGFSDRAVRNFHAANLFHDLGKIHAAYPPQIWSLAHRPTEEERAEKRLHTLRGPKVFSIALEDASSSLLEHPHVKTVIPSLQLFHHERIDGKGHFSRTGDQMGRALKAICIVDAKDGDMIRRGHQEFHRSEAQALLRMTGLPQHDDSGKYAGAFDDMLDRYIRYRERVAGTPIYP